MKHLSRTKDVPRHGKARLIVIICVMAANSSCAVITTVNHRYPLGLAAILFLIPVLLRESDLVGRRPMRRFGPFEWSCILAGLLFLVVLPFILV